jgi:hypothetical protein
MTSRTDLLEAQRIIREVFHYGDSSYLKLALTENELMDVTSWMFLTDTQISTLTYMGEDGAKHPLHLDDYLMLLVFKLHVSSKLASGTHSDAINVSFDVCAFRRCCKRDSNVPVNVHSCLSCKCESRRIT